MTDVAPGFEPAARQNLLGAYRRRGAMWRPFLGAAAADVLHGPAVTVHFDYYAKDLPRIRALEHRLESAFRQAGVLRRYHAQPVTCSAFPGRTTDPECG